MKRPHSITAWLIVISGVLLTLLGAMLFAVGDYSRIKSVCVAVCGLVTVANGVTALRLG